ncbi:hypothetical protein ACFOW1_06980 [Parasediminibacterium paludis]|uniref:Zeta toxin n=1 Tax=Parasediminibacterium paludis TaxID=908966 RepID=A0ABV8PY66_9BACT
MGIYINADDIAVALRQRTFSFKKYNISCDLNQLVVFANDSRLINTTFTESLFIDAFTLLDDQLILTNKAALDAVAQIIARFLRTKMLEKRITFSFETVFSHPSNIDIMKEAVDAGYKVYLYMVCTESPEINKYRVSYRVTQNGHNVPPNKIEERYYRSLDLMFPAAQLCYQAYFFDNSKEDSPFNLFAQFKKVNGKKEWDKIDKSDVPHWFIKYYSDKVEKK